MLGPAQSFSMSGAEHALLLRPIAARPVHYKPLVQRSFKAKTFPSAGVHFAPPAPRFSRRSAARPRPRNMLMTRNLDREKIHRLLLFVLLGSVVIGVAHLDQLWTLDSHGISPVSRKLPEWDYVNTWSGGRLALTGHVSAIFDLKNYRDFIASISPSAIDSSEWSYPPTVLLIAVPLATAPLFVSYLIWTLGTAGLLFGILRYAALPLPLAIAAIASPAMCINILFGQNGALSAALLCGGLLLLEESPLLAGTLFGLLTFKPHLGLMIPICLIAKRQWSAIAVAALVAITMQVLSMIFFGWSSWYLFVTRTTPMMVHILDQPYPQPYQLNCVSIFMFLRSLGAGLSDAWIGQSFAAFLAACVVWRAWSVERLENWLRIALTIIATFVATPYAYIYDLVSYCIALTMVARLLIDDSQMDLRIKHVLLTVAACLWLWPELQEPAIAYLYYQAATIVVLLAFAVSVGYWRMLRIRRVLLDGDGASSTFPLRS
jgi:hypothetical protein